MTARFPTHPDEATLGAYHDGELGGALSAVDEHLAACPRCRRELLELDRLDGVLGALPAVEPSHDLYDRVLARATTAAVRPHPRHVAPGGPLGRPLWALAVAVAALAALVGGYDIVAAPRLGPMVGAPSSVPLPRAPTYVAYAAPHVAATTTATHGTEARKDQPAPHAAAPSSGLGRPFAATPARRADKRTTAGRGTAIPLPPSPPARLIARTGEVDLRVADVQRTYVAAEKIAARAGGDVSGSDGASGATGGAYAATLTLRVPAARFEETMGRLVALAPRGGLLRERSRSVDLTGDYGDLRARLRALQATRARLTGIMRRARTIPDARAVLDRLTDVDARIDEVQGRIMADADGVMYAVIAVNIAARGDGRGHAA